MPTGPLDWSDRYNTPIPPARQAEYEKWRAALPPNLQTQHDYDLQGAFLDGASPDYRDHLVDDHKKPNHWTFSGGSRYDGTGGYAGGRWSEEGFAPSQANLDLHPYPELKSYFRKYEKGTPLAVPPVPTGTSSTGEKVYTVDDLAKKRYRRP